MNTISYTIKRTLLFYSCFFTIISLSLSPQVYGEETAAFSEARELYKQGLQAEFRRDDFDSALNLYISSAQLGLPAAMVVLGRIYNDPVIQVYDPDTALYWYQQASDKHESFGTLGLAKIHLIGAASLASRTEGIRLLKSIADRLPEAAYVLSQHLEKDNERLYYATKAAKQNNKEAINELVRVYTTGSLGVAPDAEMARYWRNLVPSE